MPTYAYEATDGEGQVVNGELESDDVSEAIAELESRGLSVASISIASRPRLSAGAFDRGSLDDHLDAVLTRRDVLVPALRALAGELPRGRARSDLRRLAADLAGAQSASVLRNRRVMRWLPLLVTGFTSDSDSHQLSDLIGHASREAQGRSQRRRLLAYPFALLLIALAVVVFLCLLVVPVFGNMFDDFGLRLPPLTRGIVWLSNELKHDAVRFVVVVALACAVVYAAVRLWTHFALTTRFFGTVVAGNSPSVSAMSSFTSQLAELLSIDIPLPDALWIAGQGCQHAYFQSVAVRLADYACQQSAPLSKSPDASRLPANVIYALEAGADGAPNVRLLRELAAMYGDRVGQRVDWSSGALAQFAIIAVGIVVGLIVIALFAPLVSLVSSLS